MTQTFAPLLVTAATSSSFSVASHPPTIIQIGSVAAIIPSLFGSVYNASKAALHSYSDNLALELAPFGVDVLVIITGGVISRIARDHRELSERSLYRPIQAGYEKRQVYSQDAGIPNEVYAKQVVDEALRPKSKGWLEWVSGRKIPGVIWAWRGGMADVVKWLSRLGLTWVAGWKFYRDYGLAELERMGAIGLKEGKVKKV